MLSNISRLLTVQLSPILALVSILLIFITFLSPVPFAHDSVALITIAPITVAQIAARSLPASNELVAAQILATRTLPRRAAVAIVQRSTAKKAATTSSSGPTLTFGLLGSCAKASSQAALNCTTASLTPTYNQSTLSTADKFVANPPKTAPHWMLISLLLFIFFLLFEAIPLLPKAPAFTSRPIFSRTATAFGILAWVMGMVTTVTVHVILANAASTFNMAAASAGKALIATTGNGFTLLWIAYALAVPAIICSMFKYQMQTKSV